MSTKVRSVRGVQDVAQTPQAALLSYAVADISAVAPAATVRGFNVHGADFLHVYAKLNNPATTATVRVWIYSKIAGQWFAGDSFVFNAASKFALSAINGEELAWLQIEALDAGTIDLWAGYSHVHRHTD